MISPAAIYPMIVGISNFLNMTFKTIAIATVIKKISKNYPLFLFFLIKNQIKAIFMLNNGFTSRFFILLFA